MEVLNLAGRILRKCKSIEHKNYTDKKNEYIESIKSEKKLFILGNQKTGSTAIADLISKRSGSSVMLDIQGVLPDPSWLLEQRYDLVNFSDFLFRNRREFDSRVLKEPSLTFFYPKLQEYFPEASYAFIIRNPLENIRSILNRLRIPGDLDSINMADWSELSFMPTWKLALDSTWLGCPEGSYIEALAHRWNVAANVYLRNQDAMHLIRYETFLKDKIGVVDSACDYFGLNPVADVSQFVDKQYQSKGNSGVDLTEFFGNRNYDKIKDICGPTAVYFGYNL